MTNVLLLGPGTNRNRLPFGSKPFGSNPNENLYVIDHNESVRDFWTKLGAKTIDYDLRRLVLPEFDCAFTEAHAYEVLNILPGDAQQFFALWRWLHDVLVPGGSAWASVPHWRSEYIFSYPGPQRVYTLPLLAYLNHARNITAKEDFSELWPAEYNFKLAGAWEVSAPGGGEPQGLHFHLVRS